MVHQYKLNGYNIVLDTCSGSVHTVDEVAYDIIEMYENVWDPSFRLYIRTCCRQAGHSDHNGYRRWKCHKCHKEKTSPSVM